MVGNRSAGSIGQRHSPSYRKSAGDATFPGLIFDGRPVDSGYQLDAVVLDLV